MPSSTGSSGSPTGVTTAALSQSKCVFKKICLWEDANVSAAVLTAGNLFVLFLLNENPIAWIQFGVIFGILPLGLAARVFGFDANVRDKFNLLGSRIILLTPHNNGVGRKSMMEVADLIRVSVGMILASRMIAEFGLPLTIGIVGNLIMLVPLCWSSIKSHHSDEKIFASVQTEVRQVMEAVENKLNRVHEMTLPILAGLLSFLTIVGFGRIADKLFLSVLSLCGYSILITAAIYPPEQLIGGELMSTLISKTYLDKEMKKIGGIVSSIVFWNNFAHSVLTFVWLYGVYVVSAFTGLAFVVASLVALTVVFTLSPSVVREKMDAKLTALVTRLENKITAMFSKPVEREEEEKNLSEEAEAATVVLVDAAEMN